MNLAGEPVPPEITSRIHSTRSIGQPLQPQLREALSCASGWDLRAVRLHTDAESADLADLFDAAAFAVGTDIFFARRAYDPDSAPGRWLIAHEVAHVVQQSTFRVGGQAGMLTLLPAWHPAEREADLLAARAVSRLHGAEGRSAKAPAALLPGSFPATVVQCNLNTFIQAAQRPIQAEDGGPRNCDEAVLGWLLASLEYKRPWKLVRVAANRAGGSTAADGASDALAAYRAQPESGFEFSGDWMMKNIYQTRTAVVRNTLPQWVRPGDILLVFTGFSLVHEMVVTEVSNDGQWHVKIRGFNNKAIWPQAPFGHDPLNRDVARPEVWNPTGSKFLTAQHRPTDLVRVKYDDAAAAVAHALPWESAEIATRQGPRWHYNFINGWRWY